MEEITRLEALAETIAESVLAQDWQALDEVLADAGDRELLARLRSLAGIGPGSRATVLPEPGPAREQEPDGERRKPSPGAQTAQEPMTPDQRLQPGDSLGGRYRIQAHLQRGGMGDVYHAIDERLRIPVALKLLRPGLGSEETVLKQFQQEALLARTVFHPNVCQIYDLGRDEASGATYLAMELLLGRTLRERIHAEGPLSIQDTLPILRDIVAGLDAAHRSGVVHRDLKSANIMLARRGDRSSAILMDFGIAVAKYWETDSLGDSSALPGVVGTPGYMSPEQVVRGELSPASDLYSLGVVLFEMLTGRLPFQHASPALVAMAHALEPPPSPREFVEIDDRWESVILHLLEKDPEDRPPSAVDVLGKLEGTDPEARMPRHSLPLERNEFLGRKDELAELSRWWEATNGPRVLTIHGSAGVGKTRLALRFAGRVLRQWARTCPGGVWFCDLRGARNIDEVASTVAATLGLQTGSADASEVVASALVGRGRTLLILDHLDDETELVSSTVRRWVGAAAGSWFLVIGRKPHSELEGESIHLGGMSSADASMLLEARAQAHRPHFCIDDTNRGVVEAIVSSLAGNPLAIELAVTRLGSVTVEELYRERVRDRSEDSAEVTLEEAWARLSTWQQSALAQLSVFRGGFTVDAAEAVVDLTTFPSRPTVLDALHSLLDESWLHVSALERAPRFGVSSTVQESAAAKLAQGGLWSGPLERHSVVARFVEYFTAMGAEESLDALDRHGGTSLRKALVDEFDNLLAACRAAIDLGFEEAAVSGYAALSVVVDQRGPAGLAVEFGEDVLALARNPRWRVRVLRSLANAERGRNEPARSEALLSEALALCPGLGLPREEALVRGSLGNTYMRLHRVPEAEREFRKAIELFESVGDDHGRAVVQINLAGVPMRDGALDESRRYFEEAVSTLREVGDARREAVAVSNLGAILLNQGHVDVARNCFESALSIHRLVGNTHSMGRVLEHLGVVEYNQGELERACGYYEEALAKYREVGSRRDEAVLLGLLANPYRERGRLEEAESYYEEALKVHRQLGNRRQEGFVLRELADLERRRGNFEGALTYIDQSLAILRDQGERIEFAHSLLLLGRVRLDTSEVKASEEAFQAASRIADELGLGRESSLGRKVDELRQLIENASS